MAKIYWNRFWYKKGRMIFSYFFGKICKFWTTQSIKIFALIRLHFRCHTKPILRQLWCYKMIDFKFQFLQILLPLSPKIRHSPTLVGYKKNYKLSISQLAVFTNKISWQMTNINFQFFSKRNSNYSYAYPLNHFHAS